jgi:hypothetical protein
MEDPARVFELKHADSSTISGIGIITYPVKYTSAK